MDNNKNRPAIVLVLGIVSIAYGTLGVCGEFFNFMGQAFKGAPQIPPEGQHLLNILQGIGLVLSIILVISGIGLILMKSWARWLSIVYGVLDIPLSIASSIITMKFVQPTLEKTLPANLPPGVGSIVMNMGLIVGIFCSLIYPIILLILVNVTAVRDALSGNVGVPQNPPTLPTGG